MYKIYIRIILILISIILIITFASCSLYANYRNDQRNNDEIEEDRQELELNNGIVLDPDQKTREETITLYFKHEILDYLVPEQRKIQRDEQTIEKVIVEELLKGTSKHERKTVIPPGTSVIDVSRRGGTVFVNLSEEFINNVDLATLPGKENTPEEDRPRVLAEMKRLAIYSIVNSLTYQDGINEVKIMIGNRQLSYSEMGAQLLLENNALANVDSPMMALRRDQKYNMTPQKTVVYILNELAGEPDWERIYYLLASRTMDDRNLPPIDELMNILTPGAGNLIEFEGNPVIEEEYLGDRAFVTVEYTIRDGNEKRDITDKFTVVNELDGIWKLKLPDILLQE